MTEPAFISHFASLAAVTVRHTYYADGLARGLVFEPVAATVQLMQQYRLLVKTTDNGFNLVAELSPGFTITETLNLRFNVYADDPLFASFTEEMLGQDLPLYFATAHATPANLLPPVANPARAAALASSAAPLRIGARKPAMVIDVQLLPAAFSPATRPVHQPEQLYTVALNTRALYWKYYFFGDLARYDLAIEDANEENPVGFSPCDEPLAKSGKALMSLAPLPMNLESPQRFQLKDKNNQAKFLIKRLPNASMQRIGKGRNSGGQSVYVAEIYINQ